MGVAERRSRRIAFTDLEGHVEWQIGGWLGDGARLVARLVGEEAAREMPVGERDLLLAEVYHELFGPRVEASRRCGACGEPYDFDFQLVEVTSSLSATPRPKAVVGLLADGRAQLASGHLVRAPTLADEAAVAALSVEEAEAALLARCVEEGEADAPLEPEAAAAVLEWLSPIVDIDLLGSCPECGAEEATRFSIEHYLIRALLGERRQLLREMHLLAAAYG